MVCFCVNFAFVAVTPPAGMSVSLFPFNVFLHLFCKL